MFNWTAFTKVHGSTHIQASIIISNSTHVRWVWLVQIILHCTSPLLLINSVDQQSSSYRSELLRVDSDLKTNTHNTYHYLSLIYYVSLFLTKSLRCQSRISVGSFSRYLVRLVLKTRQYTMFHNYSKPLMNRTYFHLARTSSIIKLFSASLFLALNQKENPL